jgi:predicted RNA binding protein with dsRBD fold (UPF0201 family)
MLKLIPADDPVVYTPDEYRVKKALEKFDSIEARFEEQRMMNSRATFAVRKLLEKIEELEAKVDTLFGKYEY